LDELSTKPIASLLLSVMRGRLWHAFAVLERLGPHEIGDMGCRSQLQGRVNIRSVFNQQQQSLFDRGCPHLA